MNAARRGKTLSVSLFRIRGCAREFSSAYVPKSRDMTEHDGEILINFLQRNNSITCLTGAGISTESGIPDYRSKGVGLYDRENHKPILHQEFMRSEIHRSGSKGYIDDICYRIGTQLPIHFRCMNTKKKSLLGSKLCRISIFFDTRTE